ncbi:hypothetical protein PIB30_079010 [Stylosanthes scabra]|uniref:Uncharacterized protein n=1 Tax=Stylosanthes scabra TaxID=79078 RepID=A0ABU6XPE0_9FABA|nr:hypothetical protein [Stylosanthes scabra]
MVAKGAIEDSNTTLYVAQQRHTWAMAYKEAEFDREITLYYNVALPTSYVGLGSKEAIRGRDPTLYVGQWRYTWDQEDATSDSFNSIPIQVVRSQLHSLIKGLIGKIKDIID